MRVCLVGGIFGKPPAYQAAVSSTPETTLRDGLRARGIEVDTRGHFGPFDYERHDVVHVHHLSFGAISAASVIRPRFALTPHLQPPPSRVRRRATAYAAAHADAVVALSQAELRWQRSSYGVSQERQFLIPNGIDAHLFRFAPPPPLEDRLQLLFVGQLVREKGVRELIEASAQLSGRVRVELNLIYQVNDDEQELRQLADASGIAVRFLGRRRPAEVAAALTSAHALVLPSRTEALPSVVTEALLVGRPVIATRVGGIPEQIGDFGILVSAANLSGELAGALEALLVTYPALVDNAYDISSAAGRRFSVSAMLDGHIRMYERILTQSRRTRGSVLVGRAVERAAVVRRKRTT